MNRHDNQSIKYKHTRKRREDSSQAFLVTKVVGQGRTQVQQTIKKNIKHK
jgi:hypothetical protein